MTSVIFLIVTIITLIPFTHGSTAARQRGLGNLITGRNQERKKRATGGKRATEESRRKYETENKKVREASENKARFSALPTPSASRIEECIRNKK